MNLCRRMCCIFLCTLQIKPLELVPRAKWTYLSHLGHFRCQSSGSKALKQQSSWCCCARRRGALFVTSLQRCRLQSSPVYVPEATEVRVSACRAASPQRRQCSSMTTTSPRPPSVQITADTCTHCAGQGTVGKWSIRTDTVTDATSTQNTATHRPKQTLTQCDSLLLSPLTPRHKRTQTHTLLKFLIHCFSYTLETTGKSLCTISCTTPTQSTASAQITHWRLVARIIRSQTTFSRINKVAQGIVKQKQTETRHENKVKPENESVSEWESAWISLLLLDSALKGGLKTCCLNHTRTHTHTHKKKCGQIPQAPRLPKPTLHSDPVKRAERGRNGAREGEI